MRTRKVQATFLQPFRGSCAALGASLLSIVNLFSFEFAKLVVVALFISMPLTFLLVEKWLDNFANRTEVGSGVFVVAGVTALILATVTVSFRAITAALSNPVEVLKCE